MDSPLSNYADVLVETPLRQVYTYKIPERLQENISEGMAVSVPLGRRKITGYIYKLKKELKEKPEFELKEVKDLLFEEPLYPKKLFGFFEKVSAYYHYPLGAVVRGSHPKIMKRIKKKEGPKDCGISSPFDLTPDQSSALEKIKKSLNASDGQGTFKSYVLYGITGSGKTEVYLNAMEETLALGRSALLIVPEISLTPQLVQRVKERFGDQIALLHSQLSDGERFNHWIRILRKEVKIAVGARSALFAPFQDLGLIVVDEEHESSFKQEDRLRYHARDLCLLRAKFENCPVILGSATPSLESFYLAEKGKHELLELRTRTGTAELPETKVIDLRKNRPVEKFCSKPLIDALKECFSKGEQAILFANKRGYAPYLLCEDCGEIFECANCSVSLTFHKKKGVLRCHYCDHEKRPPETCPSCDSIELSTKGMGTESIEEELEKLFPQIKMARMDRDSTSKKGELEKILSDFSSQKTQLLIGTQMLAKGHDFPGVSLVGLVMPDFSLHLPDFRSNERTFQLITQVSGRAGRGEIPGKVMIQTYNPKHEIIQFGKEQNFRAFYKRELETREAFSYPPFSRLAMLWISSVHEKRVVQTARNLAGLAEHLQKSFHGIEILGPSPAPLEKIKNRFRWQIMIKAESAQSLNGFLKNFEERSTECGQAQVRWSIDVDPMHTL
jgi:primosomal protein N' (replication factor Y)